MFEYSRNGVLLDLSVAVESINHISGVKAEFFGLGIGNCQVGPGNEIVKTAFQGLDS